MEQGKRSYTGSVRIDLVSSVITLDIYSRVAPITQEETVAKSETGMVAA